LLCGDSAIASATQDFYTASFGNSAGNYADGKGLAHQGEEVKAFVDKIVPDGTAQGLILVAHSNGGLASRSYFAVHRSEAESKIVGLITYGTPHFGADETIGFSYLDVNPVDFLADGARDAKFVCSLPIDPNPEFQLTGYSTPIDLSPFLFAL